METDRTRLVVGCMTGTSLDGLDVALVKIVGTGLDMRAELLGHHALPMPDALRATLMSLASGEASEPIVYMRAARALGELHADGVEQLLAGDLESPIAPEQIDFITAHGQTIWHAPRPRNQDAEAQHDLGPMSWQLFDPWPMVRRLNRPVCYDLRQADLIAGGEGAPLTPIADWVLYRNKADLVLNLGGVCSATWLRKPLFRKREVKHIKGWDLCPCNLLLNGLSEHLLGQPYDHDGKVASNGSVDKKIIKAIRRHVMDYAAGEKSLGREFLPPNWVKTVVAANPIASPGDILASAIFEICTSIGYLVLGIECGADIVLAGGGVRNLALCRALQKEFDVLGEDVTLSDDLGIPCEAREAMGFAVLGALSQDGVPISLPQVTGATDPGVAGVWANP